MTAAAIVVTALPVKFIDWRGIRLSVRGIYGVIFMRSLCVALLVSSIASTLSAQVGINRNGSGWDLTNGHIQVRLARRSGQVFLQSLSLKNGREWAASSAPVIASPDSSACNYRDDNVSSVDHDGKQLMLRFNCADGGVLSLALRIYPTDAVVETQITIDNPGTHDLSLSSFISPLNLELRTPSGGFLRYTSRSGQHGFYEHRSLSAVDSFSDWLVLVNPEARESLLVGGDMGLGILPWRATVSGSLATTTVRAGNLMHKPGKIPAAELFLLPPGKSLQSPVAFIALANGDTDDVGNVAFRFLKAYVMQKALPNSPLVAYCIWLTEPDSAKPLLKELDFAKQMGFDVFYHDASWYSGSSLVPGMNDWTSGLGSYTESRDKFPDGMASFANAVHAAGMRFGVWVDPGNVDASLVTSGKIPARWLAMIDGKPLGSSHPSLTPTLQLCLGDPEVVAWIEQQLSMIIEKWHIDWIKWDPSATVSYECNRTDHGHGKTNGAYAAYRGRQEILHYLLQRFPNLSGFEVDPSLEYSRTNPGPQGILPGGYTYEFMTGPMLSPNVWGSLGTAGGDASSKDSLTGRWYSASYLDYYWRRHFTHGVIFGNVNGMSSQLLSLAPPGFIEAFRRNLLAFHEYRHLLLDDVYHPQVSSADWSSIQYVDGGANESVVFVFRDGSKLPNATVRLRGLDPTAVYRVTSLNDRPGRDRRISGASLAKGISFHLPNDWLAKGDGINDPEFAWELQYGSDLLLIRREP